MFFKHFIIQHFCFTMITNLRAGFESCKIGSWKKQHRKFGYILCFVPGAGYPHQIVKKILKLKHQNAFWTTLFLLGKTGQLLWVSSDVPNNNIVNVNIYFLSSRPSCNGPNLQRQWRASAADRKTKHSYNAIITTPPFPPTLTLLKLVLKLVL